MQLHHGIARFRAAGAELVRDRQRHAELHRRLSRRDEVHRADLHRPVARRVQGRRAQARRDKTFNPRGSAIRSSAFSRRPPPGQHAGRRLAARRRPSSIAARRRGDSATTPRTARATTPPVPEIVAAPQLSRVERSFDQRVESLALIRGEQHPALLEPRQLRRLIDVAVDHLGTPLVLACPDPSAYAALQLVISF